MKFSEHWLRTLVDPPIDSDSLAHALTMAGLEVEARAKAAPAFSGVVAARVLSVDRHPNADRLTVCRVDAGCGDPLSIVCGAPNVAPGMVVPCALVGATLPAGLEIRKTAMRGVESQGMLCSASELGISDDSGGLLVLDPPGFRKRRLQRLEVGPRRIDDELESAQIFRLHTGQVQTFLHVVVPCSLAGVNPAYHPEIFGNAAAAQSFGFVQARDGTWHVQSNCFGGPAH